MRTTRVVTGESSSTRVTDAFYLLLEFELRTRSLGDALLDGAGGDEANDEDLQRYKRTSS